MVNNLFVGVGKLVSDAELMTTPGGRLYVRFRMELPRDPQRPRKVPRNDFQTVVCYGEKFVGMVEHLVVGQEVLVIGWAQSRDLPDGRVVNEIGADTIALVATPHVVEDIARLFREAITANRSMESFLRDRQQDDNVSPIIRRALAMALNNADGNGS